MEGKGKGGELGAETNACHFMKGLGKEWDFCAVSQCAAQACYFHFGGKRCIVKADLKR